MRPRPHVDASARDVVSISAPALSGLVVSAVCVDVGARVAAGDSLIDLEDARSLYALASPVDGEVVEILVAPRDRVRPKAVVVRLRVDGAKGRAGKSVPDA